MTGASNLLGTMPPVARIAARAHAVGALVHVDGVHLTAHSHIDVTAMGADLFVCSPYKFFGPHCAAPAADPALLETLRPDKLLPSTDVVPERFELGTLPYEIMAGATAAVDVIASLAPGDGTRRERLAVAHALVHEHEHALRQRIEAGPADLGDRVTVHSPRSSAPPRSSSPSPIGMLATPRPSSPSATCSRRPGPSTRTRPSARSRPASTSGCGSVPRPTPTTATWTGCSAGSRTSRGADLTARP
ncbi:aminotransferase class V-fold PLP-dependent enzyme [Janibacter limosus]|uniref:aminotransferase class V-fold PLP-dependent enzyme n=1 Tax=Janibacter limosus TaxID=53458 RepID=UPI00215241E2|nr:aminotransferase class V-fold PLP-dependent enzyme [Janibacter limosus]WKV15984.1 aminotransferase class V-fold PLP-dependent enzyme [Janibacter limosus]